MLATLQDLIRQALVYGTSIFVAALFAAGVFFVLSLLLVPLAALRRGQKRQGGAIEQERPEGE